MLMQDFSINGLMIKLGINHGDCGLPESEPAPSINQYCNDALYLLTNVIPPHSDLYNWLAAATNHFDLIAWQHNAQDLPIWRTSYLDTSILHIAASQERWGIVQEALQCGITSDDLNQVSTIDTDFGRTPLWHLVNHAQHELLAAVADRCQHLNDAVDLTSPRGLTISTMLRLLPQPTTITLENCFAANTTPHHLQLRFAASCGNIEFLHQDNMSHVIHAIPELHQLLIKNAARENQLTTLKYLLELHGDNLYIQHSQLILALNIAIASGHESVVTYLLTKLSFDVITLEHLELAANNHHLQLFAKFLPSHLEQLTKPSSKFDKYTYTKYELIGKANPAIAQHYFQALSAYLSCEKIATLAIEAAFHAIFIDNIDLLKHLMQKFTMHPLTTCRKGRSLVRCAVKHDRTNILHHLITTYNLTYEKHLQQEALLYKALEMKNPGIATYLINKYPKILHDEEACCSFSRITPLLSVARQHNNSMLMFLLAIDNKLILDTDRKGFGAIYHGCDTTYKNSVTDFVFALMQSDPRCEAIIENDLGAIAFKHSSSLTPAMTQAVTKLIQKLIQSGDTDKIKSIMRDMFSDLDRDRLEKFLITRFANGDIPLLFALRHQSFDIADIIYQKHHAFALRQRNAPQKAINPVIMPQAKYVYPAATSTELGIPNEYICPIMQNGAIIFRPAQVLHGTKKQHKQGKSFEQESIDRWQQQNTPRFGPKPAVKCPVTKREIIATQRDTVLEADINRFILANQAKIAAKDITLPANYIAHFIGDVCNSGYLAKQYTDEPRLGYMFLTMIGNKSALHMVCENDLAAEFKLFLNSIPKNAAARDILFDKEHEHDLSLFDIAVCFGSWQVLSCIFTEPELLIITTKITTAILEDCIYNKQFLLDNLAEQLTRAKQQEQAARITILERYQQQLQTAEPANKKRPATRAEPERKKPRSNTDNCHTLFSVSFNLDDSSDSSSESADSSPDLPDSPLDAPATPEQEREHSPDL